MAHDSNAIADRVAQLQDQWLAFANRPHTRLLIWRADACEAAVVEAFIARESESEVAETPDLFLALCSNYANDHSHSHALIGELTEAYDAAAPRIEPNADARWRAPKKKEGEDELSFLVRVLVSFRRFHAGESDARLAIRLEPATIASRDSYLFWLQRLVHEAPGELRFLTLVDLTDETYAPLAKTEPERVVLRVCGLEMAQAMGALASKPGKRTPGDQFRQLQLELGEKLGQGDLGGALSLATAAEKLASEQNWPQLTVVIRMMLGSGYAASAKPREALEAYAGAEQSAIAREAQETERATDGSEPAIGGKLRLHARLAQGATLLGMRAYKHAANMYMETIPVAQALADARAELDCHRLASLSYAEDGQTQLAWQLGIRGLRVGMDMDEETRRSSTLPYLADQLLRLCAAHEELHAHRRPLDEQVAKALGAQWRDALRLGKVA